MSIFKNNIQKLVPDIDKNKLNRFIPQDLRNGKTLSQSLRSQYEKYQFSKDSKTIRLFGQADRLADMLDLRFPNMVTLVKRFQAVYNYQFSILIFDSLLQLAEKCSSANELLELLNNLEEQTKDNVSSGDQILFSTIHSAKGMEFDHVYIIDAIDGVFPSDHAIDEGYVDEEKRLFYVAVTRARDNLTIYRIKDIESPFIVEFETRDAAISHAIAIHTLINQNGPISYISGNDLDSFSRLSTITDLNVYHDDAPSSKKVIPI